MILEESNIKGKVKVRSAVTGPVWPGWFQEV